MIRLYIILPEFVAVFICTKLAVSSKVKDPTTVTSLVIVKVFPLFNFKLDPDDTVSVLDKAILLLSSIFGWLVTFGIVTSDDAVGKLPQDQFVVVNQLVLVEPVQVFDELTVTVVTDEYTIEQFPL